MGSKRAATSATFRKRLSHLRDLAEGISTRETDALAGLRGGHTWLLESSPTPHVEALTVQKLADVFGVSIDWLWLGKGSAPTAISVRSAVAFARGRRSRTGTDD